MEEYLAFVDEIGRTRKGGYLYRLDFSTAPEKVWGNYFNSVPAVVVPNLQADKETLSSCAKFVSPHPLELAKRNGCFSMQDCIDGIISLCFYVDGKDTLNLPFGIGKEDTVGALAEHGIELFDFEEIIHEEETDPEEAINAIIEQTPELLVDILVGNEYNLVDLNVFMFSNGYNRVDYVGKAGEYSIRGHIVDIMSFHDDKFYRLSFFGNELETITIYDGTTAEQTPLENVEEVKIYKR